MTKLHSERLALRDGRWVSYAEAGDRSGTPLLLLHGYTDSWRSFRPLMAALPPTLRLIAVSQRGHGDSARPADGYRLADFAGDLPEILDRLSVSRAVVVGHSMGSAVAQRFAIDRPDRVSGLVLIGAFSTLGGNQVAAELWEAVAGLADPVDPAFARDFQQSTLARPVPAELLDEVVAESLKLPAGIWRAALRSMLDEDLGPELGRIAAPSLAVWGDRDGLIDRAGPEALCAAIPGARLVVHPGCGHAPHWEEPALVARDITEFLAAIRPAAGTARRAG